MGGWAENERAKKGSSKTINIVSYALEVSVSGVTCVCSAFQVIRHILKFVKRLNSEHPCVHQIKYV